MKILWLCNIMLPAISNVLDEPVTPYGGWLSSLCDDLAALEQLELAVCFPHEKSDPVTSGNTDRFRFFGFKESARNAEVFERIIRDFSPDIIHIWGTEYKHTLDMVNAADRCGMLDRVVINIQGLVSIYGKYHYYCGLPESVYKSASLIERKRRNSIEDQRRSFIERGNYEIEAIKKVKYVVGRTDWDEACTKQINPNVCYHHCNESLRRSFYENRWSIDTCERHSVFLSQVNYPVKGFHLMLEAMPLILARYPDTRIYTTGNEPRKPENWKYRLTYRSYSRYLRNLLDENDLNKHVTFTGFLDEQQMCRQFLKANVFVSPSSIENSSNSIGEAMLLGMPVVASDVGGIKNLMVHGSEGYIYQQDAPYMLAYYVCKVFEDESRATAMGACARDHAVKTHDRKKNTHEMLKVYEQVMKNA